MAGEHHAAGRRRMVEEPAARSAGSVRELAEYRDETGIVYFDRVVEHVAAEQSDFTTTFQLDRRMIDAVPGRRQEADARQGTVRPNAPLISYLVRATS
jgi:hypothetical protein